MTAAYLRIEGPRNTPDGEVFDLIVFGDDTFRPFTMPRAALQQLIDMAAEKLANDRAWPQPVKGDRA